MPARPESEAAWLAELHKSARRKHTDETPACDIIFTNGDHGVRRAERPLRPEIAPAWVQAADSAGITNDFPVPIESENVVGSAVDEEQSFSLSDAEPARIGNPGYSR